MFPSISSPLILSACALALLASGGHVSAAADSRSELRVFFRDHCVKCHGPDKQKGDIRLDTLTGDIEKELETWLSIRDQLEDGLMPPRKEKQPSPELVNRTLTTLKGVLPKPRTAGLFASDQLPNKGNLLPHELLFGRSPGPVLPTPGRIWRLTSEAYFSVMNNACRGKIDGLVKPFTPIPERGFKDYAALYSMDEPTTEILLRNAAMVVEKQTAHELKEGRVVGKSDSIREFVALMDPAKTPTSEEIAAIVTQQFKMVLGRPPMADEVARYQALYEKCAAEGDRPGAAKTVLQIVLVRADAIFRSENGGAPDGGGHRLLTPEELSTALSLALGYRKLEPFATAAAKGQLTTREQVGRVVRAVLDSEDSKVPKPRLLEFFQQYFGYTIAPDIFKEPKFPFPEFATEWVAKNRKWPKGDETKRGSIHSAAAMIADTDRLVLRVLGEDKDVLRRLLTTDEMYVNYRVKEDKKTRTQVPAPATELNAVNDRGMVNPAYVYGFDTWPADQPVKAPTDKPRQGILMQPSWLVSHSTNFETDPVRRGRWIRERLLGQTVPDLPIGVAAQVPDEPHHTFRDRLRVTREEKCYKCHQWMDDLGLPFEQFDHYGVFRKAELVVDEAATARNVDKKGQSLGKIFQPAPLDTRGEIALTNDPKLDGPVQNPYELVRRLADSTRVRQVFVRHAFRYFMGRNETVNDAKTLQEADEAYVGGGGSFKALVVSLLSSESYLYRASDGARNNPPATIR